MDDFESTAPSAVLQVLSPSGTKRLCVAHPLLFRPGARVALNEGGATEETHVVSNFQPQSLVINSVLLCTHAPGEALFQMASGTDVEVLHDVSEGEESVIDVVPAAGVSGDPVVDSSGSSFGVACLAS